MLPKLYKTVLSILLVLPNAINHQDVHIHFYVAIDTDSFAMGNLLNNALLIAKLKLKS